jgi:hypothetical protein
MDIENPLEKFPAAGDYSHLDRVRGTLHSFLTSAYWLDPGGVRITLDKVIDKGEIHPKLSSIVGYT